MLMILFFTILSTDLKFAKTILANEKKKSNKSNNKSSWNYYIYFFFSPCDSKTMRKIDVDEGGEGEGKEKSLLNFCCFYYKQKTFLPLFLQNDQFAI